MISKPLACCLSPCVFATCVCMLMRLAEMCSIIGIRRDWNLMRSIGLHDGRWALIEVKLGEKQVDIAAAHLKKLADRIDQDHEGRPSFLMVLTATAAAYRRDDGVLVVPLATLAP